MRFTALPGFFAILALSMATIVAACSSRPSRNTEPATPATAASEPQLRIIDVHTHTDFSGQPEENSGIPDTKEEFFRDMKETNVVGAISHAPRNGQPVEDLRAQGVIHCAGLGDNFKLSEVEAGLKSGRYGCIKIYLGYVHRWSTDRRYAPVYRLAEKYDVPVVFHTGDIYSEKGKLKYADPLTVDEIAVDYPKVRFVIAHCGNPWIQSAAEVAYKNPNVYLECSALLLGPLSKLSDETVTKYLVEPIRWIFGYVENPSKIMFGTDWPLVSMKEYVEAYKRAIPREHWQAVFHDNAVKVFKFKSQPQNQPQAQPRG